SGRRRATRSTVGRWRPDALRHDRRSLTVAPAVAFSISCAMNADHIAHAVAQPRGLRNDQSYGLLSIEWLIIMSRREPDPGVDDTEGEALDLVFSALGDPVRRAILARLDGSELLVSEIAEPFDISLQAVSKHIQVL